MAGFPGWVLDAVIVHELAHLVEANHGPAFHALANRYPKQERAYGFLLAMQLTDDDRRGLAGLVLEAGEPLVHALVDLLERPLDSEQLSLDPLQHAPDPAAARADRRRASREATLGGRVVGAERPRSRADRLKARWL